jgi:hypothetical protein
MRAHLSELIAVDDPFVSVYLASPSTEPQAADQLELRWKNVRRALEGEGADDETLAAVNEFVVGERSGVTRHSLGETLAVVAAGGRVLVGDGLAGEPADELDRYRLGLLPWLVPLIEADQRRLPHVVVLIDRKGVDLHGYRARGDEIDEQVEGDDPFIEHNASRRVVPTPLPAPCPRQLAGERR